MPVGGGVGRGLEQRSEKAVRAALGCAGSCEVVRGDCAALVEDGLELWGHAGCMHVIVAGVRGGKPVRHENLRRVACTVVIAVV